MADQLRYLASASLCLIASALVSVDGAVQLLHQHLGEGLALSPGGAFWMSRALCHFTDGAAHQVTPGGDHG